VPILAVGLSYQTAPIGLRERLALSGLRLADALERLASYVPEGVILSTCNRTEVYAAVGHQSSGLRNVSRFLADIGEVEEVDLAAHLVGHWQELAVRHLFRVAAGLDSMILGEGQILAQVRQAYDAAGQRRPLGPLLSRLFDRSLLVGKRARAETAIARSAVSVSQAAVELATSKLGRLPGSTILVIGTGKMGELTATALHSRGAERVILMNRTLTRAHSLAGRLEVEAWSIDRLPQALVEADIVISSTGSPDHVITREILRPLQEAREGRPLVMVDIAVPRDIEPEVADLRGVHLFNVDDLQDTRAANLEQRQREAVQVEAIIEEELQKFIRWWQSRDVAPTISALVQKAETIRQEELNRALARLGPLSDREATAVNAMTLAIVNKMLHAPITRLKDRAAGLDGKHYLHAVRELFDLPAPELVGE
jgi:glutamyl-tRNA reductase